MTKAKRKQVEEDLPYGMFMYSYNAESISKVIKNLQSLEGDGYTHVTVETDQWNSCIIYKGMRPETDKEYNLRCLREAKKRVSAKKQKALDKVAQKERELKQYEKLKKKFEGK